MRDDGVDVEQIDVLDQYVITERWRRVEQVLNSSTKVLNIWMAWGATQSEVTILFSVREMCLTSFYLHSMVKVCW